MRGIINIYGCGGAGINILANISKDLLSLGEEFSSINLFTIDTTDRTIQRYPELKDNFYKIESTLASQSEIDGAAGERKNKVLVGEIRKSIKVYIDEKMSNPAKDIYNIVVFSASGGSGSTIAPLLINEMLKSSGDYNTIPICIGDTSNLLYTNNTINTIAGLNNIANGNKEALPLSYFDNNFDGLTTPDSEKKVNRDVFKLITILALFTSGKVTDIDHQDMGNFLAPSKYKTFNISPGIYRLTVKLGKLIDPNILLARSIIDPNEGTLEIEVPLIHNKVGKAKDEHLNSIPINNFKFPVYLTLEKNVINETVIELQKRHEELEGLKKVDNSAINALSDSFEDDDGLIL